MYYQRVIPLLLVFVCACANDLDRGPLATEELWADAPDQIQVSEPVLYRERQGDAPYGLPTGEATTIASLIESIADRVPERFSDPRTFTSPAGRLPCSTSTIEVLPNLPATIEGVVTLHPRQYTKVPVCDQDEKHYGTFTIEDDTGGIMVLRDSRIAPFTAGDRIRMTVHALTYTYLDPTTRTILSAEIELMDPPGADRERVVYFEPLDRPYGLDDVTRTKRIIGWVAQPPTNKNFSTMIIANKQYGTYGGGPKDRVCMANCLGQCKCGLEVCEDEICPALCEGEGAEYEPAKLPLCWESSLDVEMVRRGVTYAQGSRVSVTGPVVDSYGLKIWVQRLGQVEVLE